MKNTLFFIIFVLAIISILYFISGKKYPQIPSDAIHSGIKVESMCNECHGPQGKFPKKPQHPPKDECFKCHKIKRAPTTQQK
ncbi:MAG: cytochrome c3 family protein [Dissulfurispiraceae bacterium]